MDLSQAKQTFIEEAHEQLEAMEAALLRLDAGESDEELVNALFRAAHTIKGSAGLFGLDAIVEFTHVVESVLDRLRGGEIVPGSDLVSLLLSCKDQIGLLVQRIAADGAEPSEDERAVTGTLLEALRVHLGLKVPAAPSKAVEAAGEQPVESPSGPRSDLWHLSARFGRNVLRDGMDPLSILRYLGTLGTLIHVTTISDALPEPSVFDPEDCYLGFEIDLQGKLDKSELESAFEFVREDCQLRILPPRSKIEDYIALIEDLPEDPRRLGELLVAGESITQHELDEALAIQRSTCAEGEAGSRKLGSILVGEKLAQEPVVAAALTKQKQIEEKRVQESRLIKIQADKLDHLINLVGELVIAGATSSVLAARSKNAELHEATSVLGRLVEEIRDNALKLRMVQIGDTFNRFHRVVRDVSRELGKEISLVISGAETELDKSMVEKIADPLMHLVRNAIDHGIELPEVRTNRGKPRQGRLSLSAHHDSGSIVIEVADDGGGLNRERIAAKALERGMVSADAQLSDGEVFNLVMEAGFSTAESVTSLSGRGVGMDVVKRNLEALRGTIEIDSAAGRGATVRLRLPLTLAIIDGFLVGVDRGVYVVPLDMVVECVELGALGYGYRKGRNYINLRGEVLPFLRLREQFEIEGEATRRENVVVVRFGGKKAGLVVDRLLGEFQTVIKPMSKVFGQVKGIGGSTILGTGEVALILDVPALVQFSATAEANALAKAGGRKSSATRLQAVAA